MWTVIVFIFALSAAQRLTVGLRRLIVKVCSSHTNRHTHSVLLHSTHSAPSTQLKTNTNTNISSMYSGGFEPAIPAITRLQTHASDRTVIGIGIEGKQQPSICP
jgi:hypothetical protein